MAKRKPQKQSAKATLAEVIKEMAKPRVAMSAREHLPHCSK
jgi:TolA-binding protein